MTQTMIDVIKGQSPLKYYQLPKDFAITNVASLPTDFSGNVSAQSVTASTSPVTTYHYFELPSHEDICIQALVTDIGSDVASISFSLEGSNFGPSSTAAECWKPCGELVTLVAKDSVHIPATTSGFLTEQTLYSAVQLTGSTNSSTAEMVRSEAAAAVFTITNDTPSAGEDALTGVAEVQVLTFPAKAAATGGDYFVQYDTTGAGWAVWLDVSGTDAEPTGAIYAAIPAAQKARCDISACTDAPSVAAAVEAVFDAITAVPIEAAASGATLNMTRDLRGACIAGVVKNADDSGAGSISVADSVQGVNSAIDVTANTLTLSSHGYLTGLKVQATIDSGALPSGISALTDYFVIVVDTNVIKLATSLANAIAGTARDITDQGDAGKTVTITPVALAGGVCHLEGSLDRVNWFDIASKTFNITASGTTALELSAAAYPYVRANATVTAGQITISGKFIHKHDIGPAITNPFRWYRLKSVVTKGSGSTNKNVTYYAVATGRKV